jgi:cytochrome c2
VVLFLALSLTVPVLAGGWAVIVLDKLPGEVRTGEPLNIGFTVLQHGRTALVGLSPTITARQSGLTRAVIVKATENGPGHYTAFLILPEAGVWEWSIQAFTMDQPMPTLTVFPSSKQKDNQSFLLSTMPYWMIVGAFVLAACLAGLSLVFRKNKRMAVPLLISGLALGLFGFISASGGASPQAQMPAAPHLSQTETGKQLFIAKGCTTCHVRADISRSKETIYIDAGPNLTRPPRPSPEFLRLWLADPASVKPTTEMPNLKLSDDEIEDLVAFLISNK